MSKRISSLQKGLDILGCFDYNHEVLSALEISERLNIPLSTAYRYLSVLVEEGFLGKDFYSNKYTLGYMIFQMASIEYLNHKLVDVIKPHIESLASLSGETVILTVVKGWKALCLDRIETRKGVRLSRERGSSAPLHAGASGKTLLAYQTEAFVDAMIREIGLSKFSQNTITEPDQLKKELKRIREEGFALSDSEVELLAMSIAAPIFDHKGSVVAGLAAAGPRERIGGENTSKLIDMVKKTATAISIALGYRKAMEGFSNTQRPQGPHDMEKV